MPFEGFLVSVCVILDSVQPNLRAELNSCSEFNAAPHGREKKARRSKTPWPNKLMQIGCGEAILMPLLLPR